MCVKVHSGTFGIGGGTSWQDTTRDDNELIEMIRQAYDLGVWGLDTAPVYGTGRSERIIARAIRDGAKNTLSPRSAP